MSIPEQQVLSFTEKQGQYLAYIYSYTKINGIAPAHADMQICRYAAMQHYFKVTPPTVNQMVKMLESKKLISKKPRIARSIEILIPVELLPALD
jgi:Mn-dependent DtxR family transcriptional regulator